MIYVKFLGKSRNCTNRTGFYLGVDLSPYNKSNSYQQIPKLEEGRENTGT